jgi:polyamine oxidase
MLTRRKETKQKTADFTKVFFEPPLPDWKQNAISSFDMGTYTKIFLHFPTTFWPIDKQYFLYVSPTTRGYYPIWQFLSHKDFLPGSNILFTTVVGDEAYGVENQEDEKTKQEVLVILKQMFPNTNGCEMDKISVGKRELLQLAPWYRCERS